MAGGTLSAPQHDALRVGCINEAATRALLVPFRDQFREELDGLADEFAAALSSDHAASLVLRAASLDAGGLSRLARQWLKEVLLGTAPSDDQWQGGGALSLRQLAEVPDPCLMRAIALTRRRLVELAGRANGCAADVSATVVAVEHAMDLQLIAMLQGHRQLLLDRLGASQRLATLGHLVASIGHELRNPLSTIDTSAYLLAQRLANAAAIDPTVGRELTKIRYQVSLASNTLTNLLELAKNRPPRRVNVPLLNLVEQSCALLRRPAGVRLELNVPPQLLILADADQLRIVVLNLVSNALYAVGATGTIRISAESCEDGLVLRVSDDGPGIAPSEWPQVFEPLHTTKPNGNGIGLTLCRQIAIAHGGNLTLEPSARGAEFRLWIPLSAPEETNFGEASPGSQRTS
jgi:signal transduction histidine kinase